MSSTFHLKAQKNVLIWRLRQTFWFDDWDKSSYFVAKTNPLIMQLRHTFLIWKSRQTFSYAD